MDRFSFLIEYQFRIKISIDSEKEMSAEDYKKISFGFRPDNRFFIFRDAAAKKTGFSFRIPFGQAAIHPIQLIHLLLSPVRILFFIDCTCRAGFGTFPTASAGSVCFWNNTQVAKAFILMTARHEIISRQFFVRGKFFEYFFCKFL